MTLDMTKGNPFPIILKFMIPLFIGNVFQQLYNMADTIIVALLAMKLVLFPLAVFCDPASWISACLFTAGVYLVVIRKVRKELAAS